MIPKCFKRKSVEIRRNHGDVGRHGSRHMNLDPIFRGEEVVENVEYRAENGEFPEHTDDRPWIASDRKNGSTRLYRIGATGT